MVCVGKAETEYRLLALQGVLKVYFLVPLVLKGTKDNSDAATLSSPPYTQTYGLKRMEAEPFVSENWL